MARNVCSCAAEMDVAGISFAEVLSLRKRFFRSASHALPRPTPAIWGLGGGSNTPPWVGLRLYFYVGRSGPSLPFQGWSGMVQYRLILAGVWWGGNPEKMYTYYLPGKVPGLVW